jgi:hypothetical protein
MMKKIKTLAVVLVFSLCLFGFMASCDDPDSETGQVTGIELKFNGAAIAGGSLTVDLSDGPLAFTADVQVSGNASKDFTLTSSDTGVAAVSGKTVALVAAGPTTITATAVGDSAKKHAINLNVEVKQAEPGLIAPYYITNNFGQDSSSEFLVQWHNNDGVNTQKLQIVTETGGFGNAKEITVEGHKFESTGLVGEFNARNVFRTEVTGLSPNTQYKYRMGDTGAWSETYYHLTSSGTAVNFNFTVASDPQSGAHTDMQKTLRAADTFDPESRFYLMGGDIVDEIAKTPAEIVSYTNVASEFNKNRPIAATQGNHDTYYNGSLNNTDNQYRFGESTVFNAFVTFPDNGWDTHADKANRSQSYYFYYNKVLFIVLNTMATSANAGTAEPNHAKQAEWLKNILEKDKTEKLSRYRIVLTHVSPISARQGDPNRWLTPGVRTAYGKICTDYNVDIFFAGHDHVYTRSNPIKIGTNTTLDSMNFNDTPDGTVFSIVSATGPKFYSFENKVAQISKYFPIAKEEPKTGVFVNVKVTAEKLSVTALGLSSDGTDPTVIDTYDVMAKQ